MIKAYFKQVKDFLILKVRKISFFIALIFKNHVKILDLLFFNFFDLDKFSTVLLALTLSLPTNLLLYALNNFGANNQNKLVVFNI